MFHFLVDQLLLTSLKRSGVLNQIRSDYVRTARSKGLPEAVVILKHTVRNGIIPIVTLLGTTLPVIVGGSIIVKATIDPSYGILHMLGKSVQPCDWALPPRCNPLHGSRNRQRRFRRIGR